MEADKLPGVLFSKWWWEQGCLDLVGELELVAMVAEEDGSETGIGTGH